MLFLQNREPFHLNTLKLLQNRVNNKLELGVPVAPPCPNVSPGKHIPLKEGAVNKSGYVSESAI